jgi:CRP-like cAMP-binding protein
MPLRQDTCRNGLLRALSPADFALIRPHLSIETIALDEALIKASVPITRVHFIEQGIVSLIAIAADGERSESALVGAEGLVGLPVLLGADRSSDEARVQVSGLSLSIRAEHVGGACRQSPRLHYLLLRYAQALGMQIAHTAHANARYKLDQRLARWLLMCRDRVEDDVLPTTRHYIAVMLGVNRPSLSTVVATMERNGLIETRRGSIILRDHAGLRALAGGSYGAPEAEYARLIVPDPAS